MLIVRLYMEPTATLNHERRSCIMQSNGPVNDMETAECSKKLTMEGTIYQENQASDCMGNEELRRILP